MITSFYTINTPAHAEYKEKGSRFLAFAMPVSSEDEVKACLADLKKKYFDARHHCYAYRLGADKTKFRAYDDGEPNHSAGDPILGQLKSKDLTNVLVVVVRYFGGTKLGVGGLITAYKTSAEAALDQAEVIEQFVTQRLLLSYAYETTPQVMKLVKDFELKIMDQQFNDSCRMEADVLVSVLDQLQERLRLMNATGTEITIEMMQ